MNILLPIETINREIDFKLVLAALLSGKKNKIYIGQHNFLNSLMDQFKNGLYIGKNVFPRSAANEKGETINKIKSRGFKVIYLHEEGAVFKGDPNNWKETLNRQYNTGFFDQNDVVCNWGKFQNQHDISRADHLNIQVTGHPRFDLYKPKWKAYFEIETSDIKKKYGDYILINGNYGLYNHGRGASYVFSKEANYDVDNPVSRMDRVSFIKFSGMQCLSMIELTHQLALNYKHKNFIYRPHPSENHEFYKDIFRGVPNIFVNHDGPVSTWILGAEAIIHDGCTTALEAAIAEKPVINYKTVFNEDADIWLPNQLGVRAESFLEVKKIIDNIEHYTFDFSMAENEELVSDLFYNFKNDSFDKLVGIIEEKCSLNRQEPTAKPSSLFIRKEYLKLKGKQKLLRLKNSQARKTSDYHSQKFYGFDRKYIENKFEILEKIINKKINYTYHNPFLIEIK